MVTLLNKKFSYKYRQSLLLKHLIGGIAVLVILAIAYLLIDVIYENNFYIMLENLFGQEFAYLIHDYEPAVIVYVITTFELLMWIIIEILSSHRLLKVVDSIDTVLDNSMDTIVLPTEFSELQNWLNLLKSQNREQQHLSEIEAKRKSDSLTYLAHDIRTPLASVVGYLSLLCEAPDMPLEQRNKYTKTAFSKALQFEKMIDEFFDITRFNLSEKALNKKKIDICFLLEQLTDEFFPLLHEKELQINLDIPNELIVLADGEKIARVFNNVIKNAVLYSFRQTAINISVIKSDDTCVVTIQNNGETIPRDKLEHIFDKYYRIDENLQSNSTGTGLGLAIAKEIVRMHNGSITAISENDITILTIKLPIEE